MSCHVLSCHVMSCHALHVAYLERHPTAQVIPAGCPGLPVGDLVAPAGSDGGGRQDSNGWPATDRAGHMLAHAWRRGGAHSCDEEKAQERALMARAHFLQHTYIVLTLLGETVAATR